MEPPNNVIIAPAHPRSIQPIAVEKAIRFVPGVKRESA
jgi:hypothetical protein